MSTSTVISSIESIPLPAPVPQYRRQVKPPRTNWKVTRPKTAKQRASVAPQQQSDGLVLAPAGMFPTVDYSNHTDDELHNATVAALAAYDEKRKQADDYGYDVLIPALNQIIERYKQPGRATAYRLNDCPTVGGYFQSIGLNYNTVRSWKSRAQQRLLQAAIDAGTKPLPKQEQDRDPVPQLNKAARKALIEGNHRAVEIVAALEAGQDGKKEITNFKAVMDAERLDDIMQAHELDGVDTRKQEAVLLRNGLVLVVAGLPRSRSLPAKSYEIVNVQKHGVTLKPVSKNQNIWALEIRVRHVVEGEPATKKEKTVTPKLKIDNYYLVHVGIEDGKPIIAKYLGKEGKKLRFQSRHHTYNVGDTRKVIRPANETETAEELAWEETSKKQAGEKANVTHTWGKRNRALCDGRKLTHETTADRNCETCPDCRRIIAERSAAYDRESDVNLNLTKPQTKAVATVGLVKVAKLENEDGFALFEEAASAPFTMDKATSGKYATQAECEAARDSVNAKRAKRAATSSTQ
jgi:hypothetical protein